MKKTVLLAALAVSLAVAASAVASNPKRQVTCTGNGDNLPCTTTARLACHRKSGKIVLSRLPDGAFNAWLAVHGRRGGWQNEVNLPATGGKVTFRLAGVRRVRAYFAVPNPPPTAIPEMQIEIASTCAP